MQLASAKERIEELEREIHGGGGVSVLNFSHVFF